MKARNSFRPWKLKGIAKSSKKKQKLYEKYLKNRNPQNLATYSIYKKGNALRVMQKRHGKL